MRQILPERKLFVSFLNFRWVYYSGFFGCWQGGNVNFLKFPLGNPLFPKGKPGAMYT